MKTRILFSLLCLLIVFSGCRESEPKLESCDNFQLEPADALDDDDRAILNLILETYYRDRNVRLLQRVGSEMQASWTYATLDAFQLTVDSSIVENYALRNQQRIQLSDDFMAPILPLGEYNCLLSANPNEDGDADFWANYYAKYPESGGYMDFEIPGYDAGRNHAIIEYGIYYGGLGANGYILVLEKVGGQWTIVHQQATWIS